MDEKYIAYQVMVATREATNWAYWGMWATIASSLISFFTVVIAWRAIDTWKEQEKLKVKMDFKKSLMALKTECYNFPFHLDAAKVEWGIQFLNHSGPLTVNDMAALHEARKFKQFEKLFFYCCDSWVATEHLFLNSKISRDWSALVKSANEFIKGEISSTELQSKIHELYSQNFVFK